MSLSEKITLGGRELQAQVPGCHVLDINLGAIPVEHTAQARVLGSGSIFARKRDGVRTISLQVELPFERQDAIISYNKLRVWAETEQPTPMCLPNKGNGYINVILSTMSELSVREWYQPITLTFIAYDPYFYGMTRVANVGDTFRVRGDVPTPFKISLQVQAAIQNPKWTIDDKNVIALTGSVSVGALVIDGDQGGHITLGGESIDRQIDLVSRFTLLSPGLHQIKSEHGGIVSWTERWR